MHTLQPLMVLDSRAEDQSAALRKYGLHHLVDKLAVAGVQSLSQLTTMVNDRPEASSVPGVEPVLVPILGALAGILRSRVLPPLPPAPDQGDLLNTLNVSLLEEALDGWRAEMFKLSTLKSLSGQASASYQVSVNFIHIKCLTVL